LLHRAPRLGIFIQGRELQNDPLVEDFKSRISNFANDPTCSVGPSKRDSELEYVPENRSLPGTYDLEKRVLSGVDLNLLFHQVSQIAHTEGRTSQQNLMAAQFDMLYGGRRGLHIADIAGFHNDWCVLSHSKTPECTNIKETGRMRIHSPSPGVCCAWGAMLTISCLTTIGVEADSARIIVQEGLSYPV